MIDTLFITAKQLAQPGAEQADAFRAKSEALAAQASAIFAARPDSAKLVGSDNLQTVVDNNKNFARFMVSMFSAYDPGVLVETVLWVFRAYRSHGFSTAFWPVNLDIWTDMIRRELPLDVVEAVLPFYNWITVNIPLFIQLTDAEAGALHSDGGGHG